MEHACLLVLKHNVRAVTAAILGNVLRVRVHITSIVLMVYANFAATLHNAQPAWLQILISALLVVLVTSSTLLTVFVALALVIALHARRLQYAHQLCTVPDIPS